MTRWKKVALGVFGALTVLGTMNMAIQGFRSKSRPELGLVDGRLRACPGTPNCVNSQEQGESGIAALELSRAALERGHTLSAIAEHLRAQPRVEVVTVRDDYLHAEFTSRLFRFVDDLEFQLDKGSTTIQVRSASRVGRGDLGANRKRVERLRAQLTAAGILR